MSVDKLTSLVQTGKSNEVIIMIEDLINQGFEANQILQEGLLKGMNEIGQKWKSGKAFIPEVLITARALNAGMDELQKYLVADNKTKEVIILGTVKGDMHDIGKNLVGMMLKTKGFEVIDLGMNVEAQAFVDAVKKHNSRFVCMSALLTTTMLYFKNVVEEFKSAGIRDQVKLICGGAPVTQEFTTKIGCDYYEDDAISCAELIEGIIKQ